MTILAAQTEYDAWNLLVTECRRNGIDLNADERFHAALTAWGEELAQLRLLQDVGVVVNARTEALDRFDRVFGQVSA